MNQVLDLRRISRALTVTAAVLITASLGLAVAAMAAPGGYPGPIGTPPITQGPNLGTIDTGGSAPTSWDCGFQPNSIVQVTLDSGGVGQAFSDANGCVEFTVSVGAGPTVTISTFGPSGPVTLGPVSTTCGDHAVTLTGNGAHLPSGTQGQTVGVTDGFTIVGTECVSIATTTPTTAGPPVGPGTTTATTAAPGTTTPTTKPQGHSTTTTKPKNGGGNGSTTLPKFSPSHVSSKKTLAAVAGIIAIVGGIAAVGAAGSAGAAGAALGEAGVAGAAAGGADAAAAGEAAAAGTAAGAGAAAGADEQLTGTREEGEDPEAEITREDSDGTEITREDGDGNAFTDGE